MGALFAANIFLLWRDLVVVIKITLSRQQMLQDPSCGQNESSESNTRHFNWDSFMIFFEWQKLKLKGAIIT